MAIGVRVLPGELERGPRASGAHTASYHIEQRNTPLFLNSELSGASEFLPHSGTGNVVPMLTRWWEREQTPVLNSQFQWRFFVLVDGRKVTG